jgi:hypothetical protein
MIPANASLTPRPDLGIAVSETMTDASAQGFIADTVFPYFKVAAQSATYPVLPASAAFNVHDTKRGARGNYNRVGEEFEAGMYQTMENGLEYPVDDRFAAMYGGLLNYEVSIANLLMGKILRAREVRVASKVFNPKNYAATEAAKVWTDPAADLKADVDARREKLRGRGVAANILVVSWGSFKSMQNNALVKEAVKDMFSDAAKTGTITKQHIETYLDIRLAVAGALHNTAKKGKNANLGDIWSDDFAMVGRVADGPETDILEPCIGRTFYWNEGADEEVIVEEYREEGTRAGILRVRNDTAEHLLASRNEEGAAMTKISRQCGELIRVRAGA